MLLATVEGVAEAEDSPVVVLTAVLVATTVLVAEISIMVLVVVAFVPETVPELVAPVEADPDAVEVTAEEGPDPPGELTQLVSAENNCN